MEEPVMGEVQIFLSSKESSTSMRSIGVRILLNIPKRKFFLVLLLNFFPPLDHLLNAGCRLSRCQGLLS